MSKAEYQTMIDNGWCPTKKKLPKINELVIFCSETLTTCGIGRLAEVNIKGEDGKPNKQLRWIKYDIIGRAVGIYELKKIEYWRPNTK